MILGCGKQSEENSVVIITTTTHHHYHHDTDWLMSSKVLFLKSYLSLQRDFVPEYTLSVSSGRLRRIGMQEVVSRIYQEMANMVSDERKRIENTL